MKSLLTLSFCFSILIFAQAQDNTKKIHFGISIMPQLNITSFGGSELIDNKTALGIDVGGDMYVDVSPQIQFKTVIHVQRVRLNQRDYSPMFPDDFNHVTGEVDIYKSYYEFRSSYGFIGVPIEIKMKTSPEANHFYLLGGIHGRYKINSSGEVKLIESGVNTIMLDPDNYIFEARNTQVYFVIGGGYELKAGSKKLSFGPVLEYSTSKIFDSLSDSLQNGHFTFLGISLCYY